MKATLRCALALLLLGAAAAAAVDPSSRAGDATLVEEGTKSRKLLGGCADMCRVSCAEWVHALRKAKTCRRAEPRKASCISHDPSLLPTATASRGGAPPGPPCMYPPLLTQADRY